MTVIQDDCVLKVGLNGASDTISVVTDVFCSGNGIYVKKTNLQFDTGIFCGASGDETAAAIGCDECCKDCCPPSGSGTMQSNCSGCPSDCSTCPATFSFVMSGFTGACACLDGTNITLGKNGCNWSTNNVSGDGSTTCNTDCGCSGEFTAHQDFNGPACVNCSGDAMDQCPYRS